MICTLNLGAFKYIFCRCLYKIGYIPDFVFIVVIISHAKISPRIIMIGYSSLIIVGSIELIIFDQYVTQISRLMTGGSIYVLVVSIHHSLSRKPYIYLVIRICRSC
jgi:hypothetical protein